MPKRARLGLILLLAALGLAVLAADLYVAADAYREHRLTQRRGFTCRTITDSAGRESRYIAFVPHVPPPPGGYPVLVFLNGKGENGDDGTRQLSRNLGVCIWERKGRFPFVVVAPQCSLDGDWRIDSPDTLRALETMEEVIATHACDRDRVYLTGPSAGGCGVLAVAASRPELFAAIAPLCAGSALDYSTTDAAARIAKARLPFWTFYNERDQESLVSFNRRLRRELLRAGVSPRFTEYDAEGHQCWEETYRNPALYDWLLRQNRSANRTAPTFELLADHPGLAGWTPGGSGVWSTDGQGGLSLSDAPSTPEPATLTLDRPLHDFELHFDLLPHGDAPCEIELAAIADNSSTPTDSGFRIVVPAGSQGGGGVFDRATGRCLAAADPLAQCSLIPQRWNDVRIHRQRSSLRVECNGFLWADATDDARPSRMLQLRLHGTTSGPAFRDLRLAANAGGAGS